MTDVQITNEESNLATVSPNVQVTEDDRSPVAFYQQMVSRPDVRAILAELAMHERDEDDRTDPPLRPA